MLSISTTTFGIENGKSGKDLISFLDVIKKSGFDTIEISRHQKNILAREVQIRESGLKVWSIHGLLGYGAAAASKTERDENIDIEFERMDDTACFAPCPYVIHYTNRVNDPKAGVHYRDTIEKLYNRSTQLGFDLAVETAPYKPIIDERYPDSKEISDFVRSFDKTDLNMTIDVNHSNIHESLIDVCNNCNGLISNVHISDNHGEWEDHLPPGEGIIDFKEVYTALRKNGYSGPFNLEFHLPNDPTVEQLTTIKERVKKMLSGVSI